MYSGKARGSATPAERRYVARKCAPLFCKSLFFDEKFLGARGLFSKSPLAEREAEPRTLLFCGVRGIASRLRYFLYLKRYALPKDAAKCFGTYEKLCRKIGILKSGKL